MLLEHPEKIVEIPMLYRFRSCFIPKSKSKEGEVQYRPLAIIESILMTFHKILKNRLLSWLTD